MNNIPQIPLRDQNVILLPERALFWEEDKTLVVADAHLGKAAAFRKSGIPVPAGTTAADLSRLSLLADRWKPKAILFLGDLLHGPMGDCLNFKQQIALWRRRHRRLALLLVTGNHDLRAGRVPPQFAFDRVEPELRLGPFRFTHKPQWRGAGYGMAGHLHPAVALKGAGGLKETLPCFSIGARGALLPAFGSFSGNQVIHPARDDRVFVIADEAVIEVPAV